MRAATAALLLATAAAGPLAAQDSVATLPAPAAAPTRTSTRLLPVVFSGPLTGLAFGASALRVRAFADTARRPVTMRAAVLYSVKNQFESVIDMDAWTKGNALRLSGTLEFNVFPSPFYGIGSSTTENQEEHYTPRSFAFDGAVQRQIRPGLFLRGTVRFQDVTITSVDSTGQLVAGTIPGSRGFSVLSLGGGVLYDTRDNVYAPRRGQLIQLRAALAAKAFGSSSSYGLYGADARTYVGLGGGRVLAGQIQLETSTGIVPFIDLPKLGGPEGLRPYVNGRWRDRVQLTTQLELRTPLFGRFGGTFFTGGGTVGPRIGNLDFGHFRPQVGVGARYLLLPAERANIRADLAIGSEKAVALTIGFAEQF